ncbi:MAG: hypothetical protein K2G45_11855 [Lachnospiraceae bacterium]|nr:hypothetical protein [Lachnospiraceae bacterium]
MSGEKLIEGLDGLSKMEGLTDVLYGAIYWLVVIFIILFIAYIFSTFVCYMNRKRRGNINDNDDFLDD